MAQKYGWQTFWWLNTGLIGFTTLCCIFLFPETRYSRTSISSQRAKSSSPLQVGSSEKIEGAAKVESASVTDQEFPGNESPAQAKSSSENTVVPGQIPKDPWLGRGKPSKQQWRLVQPYEGDILLEIWLPWQLFSFPIVEFAAFVVSVSVITRIHYTFISSYTSKAHALIFICHYNGLCLHED